MSSRFPAGTTGWNHLSSRPANTKTNLDSMMTFQDLVIIIWCAQIRPPNTPPPPPPPHGHGGNLQRAPCRRIMGCYWTDLAATWNEPRKPLCFSLITPHTPTPTPFALLLTSWRELLYFHLKIHIKKKKSAHRDVLPSLPPPPGPPHRSTLDPLASSPVLGGLQD